MMSASASRVVSSQARSLKCFKNQRRNASHDAHHHHHAEDSIAYPKETFSSPFWRNSVLAVVGFVGIAKFAPADFLTGSTAEDGSHEAPWLTRVLAHHAPSLKEWVAINERHLEQTVEVAENTLLVQSAKPPAVVRTRQPRHFEQVSPHCVPVAGRSDMSDLVVRPSA